MLTYFEKPLFKKAPIVFVLFLFPLFRLMRSNQANNLLFVLSVIVLAVLAITTVLTFIANYHKNKSHNRKKLILFSVFLTVSIIIFLFQYFK